MRLSRRDVYFLSLRLTINLSVLYYVGLINGILMIWLYHTFSFYFMKWIMGLEAVSPVDTLLVHDDERNVANVVCKFIRFISAFCDMRILELSISNFGNIYYQGKRQI